MYTCNVQYLLCCPLFSLSHCSVLTSFLLMRSFCRAISAFSASSSLNVGSRNAKKVSQGSSLHRPQCSNCFVFTQQLYSGQDSTFIMSVQNGFPSCCPQPRHFVPKCSQVPQNNPHAAAKLVSTMFFHILSLCSQILITIIAFIRQLEGDTDREFKDCIKSANENKNKLYCYNEGDQPRVRGVLCGTRMSLAFISTQEP